MNVRIQWRRALVFGCLALLYPVQMPAQQANPAQDTTPKLELNVNKVLIPVVVRDKQGRVVGDLKKEDFQVIDNDKPHAVSAFTVQVRAAAKSGPASPSETGAQPPAPASAAPQPPSAQQRFIVFLFDDLHLSAEDLAQAQKAGTKVLAGALAPSDIAAVLSLSGKTNSGLTRDRAHLQEAIMSLQTRNIYRADTRDCPNISYYQAVQIDNEHSHDGPAFQDAFRQVINCNASLDPAHQQYAIDNEVVTATNRVLNLGRQDVQTTYSNIAAFLRTMATLPGERILVLVSPGFLPIEQESMTLESRIMDLAAQSNVTISALDARGLYTTELSASEHGSSFSGTDRTGGSVQQQSDYRRTAMSLAEGAMASLADGTGGTFFHNSNDLEAGFKSLTEAPEVVYVLELSLDNIKQDGTYHRLKVKVARDGVELQARRGYYMPRAEKNKK
jgi:VWFA-related protein